MDVDRPDLVTESSYQEGCVRGCGHTVPEEFDDQREESPIVEGVQSSGGKADLQDGSSRRLESLQERHQGTPSRHSLDEKPDAPERYTAGGRTRSASLVNHRGPVMARREAGLVLGRSDAIRSFCYECMGWDPAGAGSMAAAVRHCPARCCHLWPYRNGPIDSAGIVAELDGNHRMKTGSHELN